VIKNESDKKFTTITSPPLDYLGLYLL